MAQKWHIHSRDRTLGPWTAAQVRDELRAGRIDPFDMVYIEGGTIKRPLVEVDEIFQSSRVQMAEIIAENSTISKKEQSETVVSLSGQKLQSVVGDRDAAPRPSQFQALAAADDRLKLPKNKLPKGGRNYFVTDSTGRTQGPISSNEVMDLWNKGIVDARALVHRKGQPRKISIQKFVTFYERAAPSGVAFMNERQSGPRYMFVTLSNSQGPWFWLAMMVTVAALGFLGFTWWQTQGLHLLNKSNRAAPLTHRFDLRANEDLAGRIVPVKPKASVTTSSAVVINAPTTISRSGGSEVGDVAQVIKPGRNEVRPGKGKKSTHAKVNTARIKPPRTIPSRPTFVPAPPRPVNPVPPKSPVVSAAPAVAAPVAAAPKAAPVKDAEEDDKPGPAAKPQPPKAAEFTEGQNLTLSGYRFSASALASCEGKCKIAMTGPRGPITAVFFKEAHGAAMVGKSNAVTISGLVRKTSDGGWQIIVSSAQ